MRSVAATKRLICSVAFLSAVGWANQAHAQLGVGTTWVRTDAQGKGITMTVEACCNGGLRLIWQIPAMANQPATTMTVNSPMDGTEAPALVGGKPSGETMAIKRVDAHRYSAVVKMNGKPFGTSNGTVSADGKTMTVESIFQGGRQGPQDHRDVGAEIGAGPAAADGSSSAPCGMLRARTCSAESSLPWDCF